MEIEYETIKKIYDNNEPYQYLEFYFEIFKKLIETTPPNKIHDGLKFQTNITKTLMTGYFCPESKIIQIDKDLIPLIEDTKPNYKLLKLPYPAMFINQKFYINDCIINGFLLFDKNYFKHQIIELNTNISNIHAIALILDTNGEYEFYSNQPIQDLNKTEKGKAFFDTNKEEKNSIKISKIINKFSANLIHILTHNEKEITEINLKTDEKRNIKRKKNGKFPIRNITHIRISGNLKKYASIYNHERGKLKIRFFVRGFWRHYESERYVNKKGLTEWIKPHYRGNDYLETHNTKFIKLT